MTPRKPLAVSLCVPCAVVRQLALNLALAADRVANTLLGGSPNETLSQRTARAALAGDRAAVMACRVLGWISRDHCAWSLTPGTIGREIWAWSASPGDAEGSALSHGPNSSH